MRATQRVWGIGEYNRIVYGGPRAMGSHVKFLPGEHWTIILDQPLTEEEVIETTSRVRHSFIALLEGIIERL